MEFNQNQAIYLQIAYRVCDQIILGQLKSQTRLPSVRELAVQLEVNPNTVVRSYTYLEQEEMIYKQRGIGYFVQEEAKEKILEQRREIFINKTIPKLFEEMKQLDISIEEIINLKKKLSI